MLWTALAFMVTFGAVLLWGGVKRLFGVASDPKRGEAIVWGSVGLVLGAAMLAVALFILVKALPTNGSGPRR
jgi:hypothetical protein